MVKPRKLIPLFVLGLLVFPASAAEVTVEVRGIVSDKGTVRLKLCDSQGSGSAEVQCPHQGVLPAQAGEVLFRLPGVGAGTWSASAFHDENANGKFDRGLLGIPKEGYGFSRDARGRFGPPDFAATAFEVGAGDLKIAFSLIYP
ncbi:MAG: DUF2141 domain-containing protein [Alphaproteobacteria bacterium]|nr:DUF2141 domain-containing protein [Alphaproteobacteria bacterium]